jgi:methanogenic corrinoid protein MtbC1
LERRIEYLGLDHGFGPKTQTTDILKKKMMTELVTDFMEAIISLDRLSAQKLLADQEGRISGMEFIEKVVVVALERIGAGWQEGSLALSQVYMAGRICESLVDEILPPGAPDRKDQPKMAICVLSDHHKLGKVIVYSLLRASGFDLLDYGTLAVDELVERAKKDHIKILLISVLMLPSALKIKAVKEKLMDLDVKIIVGGAPFRFDDHLWREVGADAMCRTASEALPVIRKVMGETS